MDKFDMQECKAPPHGATLFCCRKKCKKNNKWMRFKNDVKASLWELKHRAFAAIKNAQPGDNLDVMFSVQDVVKAADRAHNIFTMNDANWTIEKQHAYLDEVKTWFLPMIKEARRRFPQQEPAYENVKTLLNVQAAHIRLYLEHAAK